MKDIPKYVLVVFVGLCIALAMLFYYIEEFRHNSIVQTITEQTKIAAITSLDQSARVEENKNEIVKTEFEKKFKEGFEKNLNVKLESISYSFDYLDDPDGIGIKAVRVKVFDERENKYQVTFVSNISR